MGKTRLALEVVTQTDGAGMVVIYSIDDDVAMSVATSLANDQQAIAILVADECSLKTLGKLTTILRGHTKRVRVVAIDNSGENGSGLSPELWLENIPEALASQILAQNFPHVTHERRAAYVRLAGGYMRLAADMCRHDAKIAATGDVQPAMASVADYITDRLGEDFTYVLALSLVDRIGFAREVEDELSDLCAFLGLGRQALLDVEARLHQSPGFIARAGRYLYVTPEIVAHVAFDQAWAKYASRDADAFLNRFPESLREAFLIRVKRSANKEVRDMIASTFRNFAVGLHPRDLSSSNSVHRLVELIETDPDSYLPLLRGLIDRATGDELLEVTGRSANGEWGPRRRLVWTLEGMASFIEFFEDAERSLFKLALYESEPDLGNNATSIWKQLYRIVLSGTPISFNDRLQLLSLHLNSDNLSEFRLASEALNLILEPQSTRMMGPSVVAGRIPPREWTPRTRDEHFTCLQSAVHVLASLIHSQDASKQSRGLEILLGRLSILLSTGVLEDVKAAVDQVHLADNQLNSLRAAIRRYLHFDTVNDGGRREYRSACQLWLEELTPVDLHGRIVAAVGVGPWERSILDEEAQWKLELDEIAKEFVNDPSKLDAEFEWLFSPAAGSSAALGRFVGIHDEGGNLSSRILRGCLEHQAVGFAAGYLDGILTHEDPAILSHLIDEVQATNPRSLYELAVVGESRIDGLKRVLSLVDNGLLPYSALQVFAYRGAVTALEFTQILERMTVAAEQGSPGAVELALDSAAVRTVGNPGAPDLLVAATPFIWRILRVTLASPTTMTIYWWAKLLVAVAASNPKQAVVLALGAIASDNVGIWSEGESAVVAIAKTFPDEFLEGLQERLADKTFRWRFYVGKHEQILAVIPEDKIVAWLEGVDIEIARAIARHAPSPILQGSQPLVPPITEFLLRKFEADDQLFREFLAGRHSMQMYSGDIAAQHEAEAALARRFLNHPLRRVREWALQEERQSMAEASYFQQQDEEERM